MRSAGAVVMRERCAHATDDCCAFALVACDAVDFFETDVDLGELPRALDEWLVDARPHVLMAVAEIVDDHELSVSAKRAPNLEFCVRVRHEAEVPVRGA